MVKVTFYTRNGCHLCEAVKRVLESARAETQFHLEEIDIDTDPELRERYHEEVPVVAIDDRPLFRYALDRQAFLRKLAQTK